MRILGSTFRRLGFLHRLFLLGLEMPVFSEPPQERKQGDERPEERHEYDAPISGQRPTPQDTQPLPIYTRLAEQHPERNKNCDSDAEVNEEELHTCSSRLTTQAQRRGP